MQDFAFEKWKDCGMVFKYDAAVMPDFARGIDLRRGIRLAAMLMRHGYSALKRKASRMMWCIASR